MNELRFKLDLKTPACIRDKYKQEHEKANNQKWTWKHQINKRAVTVRHRDTET